MGKNELHRLLVSCKTFWKQTAEGVRWLVMCITFSVRLIRK